MYRSVDVNYYDKKIVADIAVKIDFTSVKKLYKKSRMHNAVVSVRDLQCKYLN